MGIIDSGITMAQASIQAPSQDGWQSQVSLTNDQGYLHIYAQFVVTLFYLRHHTKNSRCMDHMHTDCISKSAILSDYWLGFVAT